MLKKEFRVTSNFEYNVTRKYGKYIKSDLSHVYYLKPKNYEGSTKIGIVISNKFHKSAVKRNRIKRLYREAIGNNFDKIKNLGYWVVVHPKFEAINKTYEEINLDITKVLSQISIS